MTSKRLISGIQPTGAMHLGNYHGAIKNWVTLQSEYDAFFLIVDLHSLTTVYEDPIDIKTNRHNLALDLLGLGIDPNQARLFFQSDVLAHAELHLILSMMTPLSWLERVPTYKDKIKAIKAKDLGTYGFLGYPVLMAADILLYKGEVVPVGQDQLAHIELTREIARRFNYLYKQDVFVMPQETLTKTSLLPGLDGQKMSKSYGNTIPLNQSEEDLTKQVLRMVTDPQRVRLTDPGRPEKCPVFSYHKLYSSADTIAEVERDCQAAAIGCVDCKRSCAASMNAQLEPYREKRAYYAARPDDVADILAAGAKKANAVAQETMTQVKACVNL